MSHNRNRDRGYRDDDRDWDRDRRRQERSNARYDYNLNDRDRYERNYYESRPSDDYRESRDRPRNEYNMYGEGYPSHSHEQGRGYRDRYEHDRNRNRTPQGYDEDRYRRDNAYPYDHNETWRFGNQERHDHDHNYRGYDRNWWDRTKDEMSSWFGDEDAERRRRMDEKHGHHGKGPKGYQRSDEKIKDDLEDNLYNDSYLDASDMEVQVEEGVVTLSGSVDSKWAKRRSEDMAEVISGVKDVKNNLSVNKNRESRNQDSRQDVYSNSSGNSVKRKNATT